MNVKLSVYYSTSKQREVQIDQFPIVIGRSADADICLCDRWVSRHHCQLSVHDGKLLVRDLNSKHGTLVNDRLRAEAQLLPGDRLGVGLCSLVAEYPVPVEPEDEPAGGSAGAALAVEAMNEV